MYEGKIIRFYRKNAKLTQSELGHGICSKTHVCKIENEQGDFSNEITLLLANKLQIDMEKEMTRFRNIGELLLQWNEEFISMQSDKINEIKTALGQEDIIQIPDYITRYKLLCARYYINNTEIKKASEIITALSKTELRMTPYEKNMFKHISGLYYLTKKDYTNAVKTMREINNKEYNNPEFYYNLAVAYRQMNSHSKAYYYAKKALAYFTNTNRFLRVIDAETLLLTLEGNVKEDAFDDTIRKYDRLIQNCVLCNDAEGKSILMYNRAYEYYKHHKFTKATKLFSDLLKSESEKHYLPSLKYYILCSLKTKMLSKDNIRELIDQGYTKAREWDDRYLMHEFKLLQFRLENNSSKYFKYMETKALPFFRESGYINEVVQQYERDLLKHLVKNKKNDRALTLSLDMLQIETNE